MDVSEVMKQNKQQNMTQTRGVDDGECEIDTVLGEVKDVWCDLDCLCNASRCWRVLPGQRLRLRILLLEQCLDQCALSKTGLSWLMEHVRQEIIKISIAKAVGMKRLSNQFHER